MSKFIDCNITENFFNERKRMCSTVTCSECPLHTPHDHCEDIIVYHHERAMKIIQQWSNEHPLKTFAEDLFEKFPQAPRNDTGEPSHLCPHHLGYCEYSCSHDCATCWSRPLSEVKK